jgi:hypothetical protein
MGKESETPGFRLPDGDLIQISALLDATAAYTMPDVTSRVAYTFSNGKRHILELNARQMVRRQSHPVLFMELVEQGKVIPRGPSRIPLEKYQASDIDKRLSFVSRADAVVFCDALAIQVNADNSSMNQQPDDKTDQAAPTGKRWRSLRRIAKSMAQKLPLNTSEFPMRLFAECCLEISPKKLRLGTY